MQSILEPRSVGAPVRLLWQVLLATLLIACNGGEPTDTAAVVESVAVTPAAAEVLVGEQVTFEASVDGDDLDDSSVSWSLEEAGEGDTLSDGVFTAGAADAPRSVLVVAASNADDRVRGTASVAVQPLPSVSAVEVAPGSDSVAAGDSVAFTATVEGMYLDDTSVSWSLEDAASDDAITSDGTFTAGAAAIDDRVVTVVATSTADAGVSGTATVTVEAGTPLVQAVTVDPGSTNVDAGGTVAFTAQVQGSFLTDTSVSWSLEGAGLDDSLDSAGSFTAGPAFSADREVTVVATSAADPDVTGTATVTVQPIDTAETGVLYVDDDSPLDDDLGPLGSQANPYAEVQAAVGAAASGDTVIVAPGTYDLRGDRLDSFPEGMTLQGAGSDQVLIDASRNASYGLHIDAVDDLTLAGFTLEGPQASNPAVWSEIRDDYGLKTSPPVHDLVLRDVVVQNSHLTEIDLNGVVDAQLIDVTALGKLQRDAGVGISVVGVDGVIFENVTTGGNAWGGVGIFSGDYAGTPHIEGIEITIDGSNDHPDGIYIDDEYADGDLVEFGDNAFAIDGLAWMVTNTSFRGDDPAVDGRSEDFVLFARDVAEAREIVDGFPTASVPDTLIRSVEVDGNGHLQPGTDFLVLEGMAIQHAVDAASASALIEVGPGIFPESVVVDGALTLVGAGWRETIVTGGPDPFGIEVRGVSASEHAVVADLAVEDYALPGHDGFNVGSHVTLDGVAALRNTRGVQFEGGSTITDVVLDGVRSSWNDIGLRADQGASLSDVTIVDSHFDDNLEHGLMIMARDPDTDGDGTADVTPTQFTDVEIRSSTFDGNLRKGMYFENLSSALIEDVTVIASGIDPSYAFNSGVDINLKYAAFTDVTLRRVTVLDSGWTGGSQSDPLFPVAVTLKARDTGSYGDVPATLDDVLIDDCLFRGPENGLRFGEPGKGNATPTNVVIEDTVIEGRGVDLGGAYAAIVASQADVTATTGNTFNGLTGADAEAEVYDADDDGALGDLVLAP